MAKACSYCTQYTHNRRTCPTLKKDAALVQKATNQYRSQLKQKFEEMGFGPGALVSFREGTYARERTLITGMIKEIGLNDISPISKGRIGRVAILCMTGPKSGKTIYHSFSTLPKEFNDILNRVTEGDWSSARSSGKTYQNPDVLMTLLSPVNRVASFKAEHLDSYEEVKKVLKKANHYDKQVYNRTNIIPESYREHDKWQDAHAIESLERYMKNGKLFVDIY